MGVELRQRFSAPETGSFTQEPALGRRRSYSERSSFLERTLDGGQLHRRNVPAVTEHHYSDQFHVRCMVVNRKADQIHRDKLLRNLALHFR